MLAGAAALPRRPTPQVGPETNTRTNPAPPLGAWGRGADSVRARPSIRALSKSPAHRFAHRAGVRGALERPVGVGAAGPRGSSVSGVAAAGRPSRWSWGDFMAWRRTAAPVGGNGAGLGGDSAVPHHRRNRGSRLGCTKECSICSRQSSPAAAGFAPRNPALCWGRGAGWRARRRAERTARIGAAHRGPIARRRPGDRWQRSSGTPAHLVLSASLRRAFDGTQGGARQRRGGPADSLSTLVDRLAAGLLTLGGGRRRTVASYLDHQLVAPGDPCLSRRGRTYLRKGRIGGCLPPVSRGDAA